MGISKVASVGVALLLILVAGCDSNTASGAAAPASKSQSATPSTVTVTQLTTVPATVTRTETVTATVTVHDKVTATPESPVIGTHDVFDSQKVAAGVYKILTDAPPAGYGTTGVSDVQCPSNQPVTTGTQFSCTATIAGASKTIIITVKDDNGRYEVGVPN